jgi:hypothetical protein
MIGSPGTTAAVLSGPGAVTLVVNGQVVTVGGQMVNVK